MSEMRDSDGVRLDMFDFPAAWRVQELGGIEHADRCSSVPGWHPLSGPAFLCDCKAVEMAWRSRRAAAGLPPG